MWRERSREGRTVADSRRIRQGITHTLGLKAIPVRPVRRPCVVEVEVFGRVQWLASHARARLFRCQPRTETGDTNCLSVV